MSIDLLILVKLIFAHFIADFCLQSSSIVEKKKAGKQSYHILHALVHATLAYIFAGLWVAWYIPVTVGISHYIIDLLKSRNKDTLRHFIVDQILHLAVLVLLWLIITRQFGIVWEAMKEIAGNQAFWIYLTGFVFILQPTSIILGIATRKWEEGRSDNGLKDAGQWIGYLERILVLTFMCLDIYEAIGFILAAKSIFRFGELQKKDQVQKTEYIMIGTLLSFTIAILDGLIIKYLV